MGPVYDDCESRDEPGAVREPLVDINAESPQPASQEPTVKTRRRCLSGKRGETNEPQRQTGSKPRRPTLGGVLQAEPEQAETVPQVNLPSDGLVDLDVVPDGQNRPGRQCMTRMEAAPVEEEPQSKGGRPRLAVAEPQADAPEPPAKAHRPLLSRNGVIVDPLESEPAQPKVDQAKLKQLLTGLRARQSLTMAVIGGLLATVVGAMVWAVVTVATKHQLGWMAIPLSFLIGGVVRLLGRGIDKSLGYLGAGLCFFGCLLGNFTTNCMFIAQTTELSVVAVLTHICKDPAAVPGLMIANFHSLDVVFYGVALYISYRLSFRRMTKAEVDSVMTRG